MIWLLEILNNQLDAEYNQSSINSKKIFNQLMKQQSTHTETISQHFKIYIKYEKKDIDDKLLSFHKNTEWEKNFTILLFHNRICSLI